MIYERPPLSYSFDALEPHIDAQTMELHYAQHHAGYVQNLTRVLQGHTKWLGRPLVEIITDIRQLPEGLRQPVRNFGGGHLNHSLFWDIMAPKAGGEPVGAVREALQSTFGNIDKFREEFSYAALSRFGSGWSWLGMDHRGRLEVFSTPNQDSPFMMGYRPILGLDVWEHAYYLRYQSRRADYIAAWWNVVNWDKVNELYEACLESLTRPRSNH
jgi:Fe-Mn family superoxide dismutase